MDALLWRSSILYAKLRSSVKRPRGKILHGDARCYLFNGAPEKSVDLIMTSPPFGLVRKKTYGNEDADRYCEWFRPFAEGFRRVLKDSGSLVIDIGGAWNPGKPTRSLYHFQLLLMLCREYGFHLAQEHFLVEPLEAPYSSGVGQCPSREGKGCGELHLVALIHTMAEGQQPARPRTIQ